MKHQTLTAAEVLAAARELWTPEQFQQAVIALAHDYGWRVASFRTVLVQRRNGSCYHATPVGADGRGWPDLHLSKPRSDGPTILYRELKTGTGRLEPDQITWRDHLLACGVDWALWHPRDWDTIVSTLKGES